MAPSRLLLVEGPDDVHTLVALLRHHGIALNERGFEERDKITLRDGGGFESLRDIVRLQLRPVDTDLVLQRLGIVVDADDDLLGRWQSVRDILNRTGYVHIPDEPQPEGTVVYQDDRPSVGVWLMPDNTLPGMLEHFVEFLVPQDDGLWQHANGCLDQLPERRFPQQHKMKAHVHTWLAWQAEPGKPIGQAITKRYLDADAPHATQFIRWVRRTFQ